MYILDRQSIKRIFQPSKILLSILWTFLVFFFISYILFTLFSGMPGQESHFTDYTGIEEYIEEDIKFNMILDQTEIFNKYLIWLKSAAVLDFGPRYSDGMGELYPDLKVAFNISIKLIFISLLIGAVISMVFIFLSKIPWVDNYFIKPILTLSYLHLLIILVILFNFSYTIGLPELFAGYLSLVIGGGVLVDYYSLLKTEYEKIMRKDYVIFAKYCGFKELRFAMTELLISFLSITLSRIPILFSGMIMLEVYQSGHPDFSGIGYLIWASINPAEGSTEFHVAYSATCILVFFFTALFYLNNHLKYSLSPKLNAK